MSRFSTTKNKLLWGITAVVLIFLSSFSQGTAQVAATCIPNCYHTSNGQSYYMYIPKLIVNGTQYDFCSNLCSSCAAPCVGNDWGPNQVGAGQVNTNVTLQSLPGATVTIGPFPYLGYVSSGTQYFNYGAYYSVHVDWNNNGTWETGETLTATYVAVNNSFTFTIPTTVTPGPKRMRVIGSYSTSSTYLTPCAGSTYYRDFKDFLLNIGYNNDAALTTVKTQTPAPFAPGDNAIQAVVTNNGLNTLSSVQVNWSINGVTQSPISYTTAIAAGGTATVNLVTQTFPQVGSLTVQAWTSLPNGVSDGNPANDMSAAVLLGAALNGNYTAGGSNPNFTSPAQAAAQLSAGGTLGPVTINVRPGTYTENIYLANMPGNLSTRPVVFQSEDGNKNTCVIQFSGLTSPAGNTGDLRNTTSVGGTPTLRLNNADWVTFKNLTLASLNVGYNTVVELCGPANTVTATTQAYGGSDYVTFDNVNFNAQVNTGVLSTMNDAVIVGVNGSLNNNLTINNCVFNNGAAQMYMKRDFFSIGGVFLAFSTTPPPAQNAWVITNNTFNNYGAFPLRIDNTADANITGNTWTSTNMITQRGIMFTQNEGNFRFNKNRVSTPVASGLEVLFFGTRTNSGTRGLVSNNFVSVPTGSAGWAINNSSALNMDYMHNTIYTNASGTTNAAAINITGSGVTPVNNIIYNAAGGPAVNITAGAVTGMNYNLLYSTGATLGYWSGFGYADLASWRSATAQDANSSSAAVTFNNVATGDYRLTTVDANLFGYGSTSNGTYGLGIRSRVSDDFYGASRSRTEVYMGAHQILPVITINPMPPSEMSGCANQTMTINANSTVTYNANMSFQWMRNGAPLIDGVNGISGSKTSTLTIANTQPSLHGGDYVLSITATGGADPAVTNIIAVTINAPIQIVRQPESRILCRNNETSLSVVANGTILGYQWQKDGQAITGATNPIYVLKNADYVVSGRYRCIMTGTCGTTTVTTDDAVVNVASPTIIARDPGQKGAAEGSTGYLDVDVNAAALAPGYSPQFQWYKGTTMLTDNGRITGTTTAQLTIRNMALADITADYYCVATGICGQQTSAKGGFYVSSVTIQNQPKNQELCVGKDGSLLVVASSNIPGASYSYQWLKDGKAIGNSAVYQGASTNVLSIKGASAAEAGDYTVVVTANPGGATITSGIAKVSVNAAPTVTTHPQDVAVCEGTDFTVSMTADGGSLTYQWKANGLDVPGATTATVTVPGAMVTTVMNGAKITCVTTNGCGTATTNSATLTVNSKPTISEQPGNTAVHYGKDFVLTVKANGSGTLEYQWKKDGNDIPGAIAASYTIVNPGNASGGSYTCVIKNGCGSVETSPAVINVTSVNEEAIAAGYQLSNAQPTPTVDMAKVSFTMPNDGMARIVLSDARGNEVAVLFDGVASAGTHTISVNALGLANGVYNYTLTSGRYTITNKLVIVK